MHLAQAPTTSPGVQYHYTNRGPTTRVRGGRPAPMLCA